MKWPFSGIELMVYFVAAIWDGHMGMPWHELGAINFDSVYMITCGWTVLPSQPITIVVVVVSV